MTTFALSVFGVSSENTEHDISKKYSQSMTNMETHLSRFEESPEVRQDITLSTPMELVIFGLSIDIATSTNARESWPILSTIITTNSAEYSGLICAWTSKDSIREITRTR